MATKKEMVKELIGSGVKTTESELMKMTNKELEKMIDSQPKDEVVEQVSQSDLMLKQMQEQMEMMMKQMQTLQEENISLKEENTKQPVVEVAASEPERKVTQVDKDRLIPVMNITAHSLVYQSKRSGAEWNWGQYGDIEYIEMQELLTMRSGQRKFMDEPFILIMDDDAVSYLGLKKMYDKMIEPENIDKVFKMRVDDFKEVVEKSPRGIQVLIVQRAKELIEKGEFDSMTKINFINEKFNTDLGL